MKELDRVDDLILTVAEMTADPEPWLLFTVSVDSETQFNDCDAEPPRNTRPE